MYLSYNYFHAIEENDIELIGYFKLDNNTIGIMNKKINSIYLFKNGVKANLKNIYLVPFCPTSKLTFTDEKKINFSFIVKGLNHNFYENMGNKLF